MAVSSNISVLLTAKVDQYKAGLQIARLANDQLGKAAAATGLKFGQLSNILDQIRSTVFKTLSPLEQLRLEQQAMAFLLEKGALDAQGYQAAMQALGKQFDEQSGKIKKAAEAEKELQAIRGRATQLRETIDAPRKDFEKRRKEILELRRINQLSEAEAAKLLKAAVADFQKNSGVTAQRQAAERQAEAIQDQINRLIERNLSVRDRLAKKRSEINQLLQQGLDRGTAAKELRTARKQAQDELGITQQQAEILKARERVAAEIKKLEQHALTPKQRRSQAIDELKALRDSGLSPQAVRAQVAAIRDRFREESGLNARLKSNQEAQDAYNDQVQRGVDLARPQAKAVQQVREDYDDLNAALRAGKISQREFARELSRLTAVAGSVALDPQVARGIDAARPFQQNVEAQVQAFQDMREAVRAGKISQGEYNAVLRNGLSAQFQFTQAVRAYRAELKAGKISQREFTFAVRQTKQELLGQTSALSSLLRPLGVLKTVAIGLTGAKIFGGVTEAFAGAFDFEKEIRRANALFEDSSSQLLDQLRQVSVEATNTATSLQDRAIVFQELARDGVDSATAMKIFGASLRFADAAGLDIKRSVGLVSEVVTAFRLRTGDAAEDSLRLKQAMDLLTKAADQTSSDVEQIAQAFINFAPQASTLRLGLRESAAAIIALSNAGKKGQDAGTELGIAFREVTREFTKNRQAFEQLGVKVFDSEGDFIGIATTILSVEAALRNMSDEQRVSALSFLGLGDKAAKFVQQLAILKQDLVNTKVSFEETNGAVEKIVTKSLTPFTVLMTKLKTQITDLINSGFVRWVNHIALKILTMKKETVEWLKSIGKGVVVMLAFAAGARAVGVAIGIVRRSIELATKSWAIFQALTGPKGWAQLIAGAAAAAIAYGVLSTTFDEASAAAQDLQDAAKFEELQKQALQLADDMDRLTNSASAAGQQMANISAQALGKPVGGGGEGAGSPAATGQGTAFQVPELLIGQINELRAAADELKRIAGSDAGNIAVLKIKRWQDSARAAAQVTAQISGIRGTLEAMRGDGPVTPFEQGIIKQLDEFQRKTNEIAQGSANAEVKFREMNELVEGILSLRLEIDAFVESTDELAASAAAAATEVANVFNQDLVDAGIAAARPWMKTVGELAETAAGLQAAVDSGKISVAEYSNALVGALTPADQFAAASEELKRQLSDVFGIAADEANAPALFDALREKIIGKDTNLEDMKRRAEEIFKETRTPVEQLGEKLQELQDLSAAGLGLDPDTEQRAIKAILKDYQDAVSQADREKRALNFSAVEVRTQADFASRFTVKAASRATEAQLQKQQVDQLVKTNKTLGSILTELQNRGLIQPPAQQNLTVPGS